jgi:hypothetical protein
MVDYSAWRKKGDRVVKRFDVDKARAQKVLDKNRAVGRMQIGEVDAKEIFRAYVSTSRPGSWLWMAPRPSRWPTRSGTRWS